MNFQDWLAKKFGHCQITGCEEPAHADCQWATDGLPKQEASLCEKHVTELWTEINPLLQLNKGWFRIDRVGAIVDQAFHQMRLDIDRERNEKRIMNLDDSRLAPADEAFALYDFGEERVKDSGGWEFTQGEGVWKRSVFFENGDNPSVKKTFVVKFEKDTIEVQESYVE